MPFQNVIDAQKNLHTRQGHTPLHATLTSFL